MEEYVVYSLPIEGTLSGKLAGGLQSVIAATLRDRKANTSSGILHIISPDKESFSLPEYHAEVISANPGNLVWSQLYDLWFDEYWAYLHPNVYTIAG